MGGRHNHGRRRRAGGRGRRVRRAARHLLAGDAPLAGPSAPARGRRPAVGRRGLAAGARVPRAAARGSADRARGGAPPWRAGAPAELLDALRGEPGAAHVTVHPLGAASVAALVRVALPGADEHLCAACLTASAGNPFYLGELLVTLAVDGHDADPVTVARAASIPSIADRVGRRIAPSARTPSRWPARWRCSTTAAGWPTPRPSRGSTRLPPRPRHGACAAWRSSRARTRPRSCTRSCGGRCTTRCRSPSATRPTRPRPRGCATAAPLPRPSPRTGRRSGRRVAGRGRRAARRRPRCDGPRRTTGGDPLAGAGSRRGCTGPAAGGPPARARPGGAVRPAAGGHRAPRGGQRAGLRPRPTGGDRARPRRDPHRRGPPGGRRRLAAAGLEGSAPGRRSWRSSSPSSSRCRAPSTPARSPPSTATAAPACHDRRGPAVPRARPSCPHRSPPAAARRARRSCRSWSEGSAAGGCWPSAGRAGGRRPRRRRARRSRRPTTARWRSSTLSARARDAGALIGTMTALGYRGWIRARAGDLAAAEAELRPLVDAVVEHDMPLLVAGGAFFALDAMLERSSLEDLAATVEALEADRRFLETGGGAMIVDTGGACAWPAATGRARSRTCGPAARPTRRSASGPRSASGGRRSRSPCRPKRATRRSPWSTRTCGGRSPPASTGRKAWPFGRPGSSGAATRGSAACASGRAPRSVTGPPRARALPRRVGRRAAPPRAARPGA